MERLKQLSELAGIPGREERVRAFIEGELEGEGLNLSSDKMGNLIAYREGGGEAKKRVMIVAHMDEIGFYVKHIDEKGFLRVHNVGGFDVRQILSRQVSVAARGGDLDGVMSANLKAIHTLSSGEKQSVPAVADLFVDLGLPADEVKKRVRVGDMVTLKQTCQTMGERVSGKAMDDRAGCWVLIELLKTLKTPEHDVYGVFSVQEEVGLRGAKTSAFGLEPDIGIALDVTLAQDIPGTDEDKQVSQLGEGVALKVLDASAISTRWLLDEFIDLAEAKAIPHQLEVLTAGGTDAAALQLSRAGVPSLTLSLPCRYVHTVTETVDRRDLRACVDLLTAYLG